MLTSFVAVIFGCRHSRTTFPLTPKPGAGPADGGTHVTCLDCGKEFQYDWKTMRIGEAVLPRRMAPGEHQVDRCTRSGVVITHS